MQVGDLVEYVNPATGAASYGVITEVPEHNRYGEPFCVLLCDGPSFPKWHQPRALRLISESR